MRAGARRCAVLAAVVACLIVTLVEVARAQPAARPSTAPQDAAAVAFVLGNVEFVLVHELAHFLIAEKDVPVLGPEENAADYIAAVMLIRGEGLDAAGKQRALGYLLAAADAFAISWDLGSELHAEVPYWAAHALSIQRYYQIACLLYGSDPEGFASLPELASLPPERAANCAAEFGKANSSIEWLLETFGRKPQDAPGPEAKIVYEPPSTLTSAELLEAVRERRLLEVTLERLTDLFVLEAPFTLAMRRCGRREAAWLAEQRELVICHELVDTFYLLGRRERRSGTGRGAARG
jgi:hypothetical protein